MLYLYYTLAFIVSFVASFLGMPALLKLCHHYKLYDKINSRKLHKQNNIPRLGGFVFLPSMLVGMGLTIAVMRFFDSGHYGYVTTPTMCVLGGMVLIFLVGILDDIFGLKATVKFVMQSIAAVIMPVCGLCIDNLGGLLGLCDIPMSFAWIVTVLLILLIVNGMNLIDGIDGLSSSLAVIALGVFAVLFHEHDATLYVMLTVTLIASLLVFMRYNLFGRTDCQTKIFMGDTGSLLLGYTIAFFVIKYCTMSCSDNLTGHSHALLTACTLVMVPVFDLVRVAFTRLCHGEHIFNADKRHIHHLCAAAGIGERRALLFIVCLQIVFCILNVCLCSLDVNINVTLLVDVIVFALAIRWLIYRANLIKANNSKTDNVVANVDNMCVCARAFKRGSDIFFSLLLIMVTLPAFVVICIILKCQGDGIVFFSQERIGRGGRPFMIRKFCTMYRDSESDGIPVLAKEDDARQTRFGRLLRSSHFDELPQLWNVLCGDMSFVGYRPERRYFIDQIMRHNPDYACLYQIRPGVTSPATLYNGYTDTMDKMLRRLDMDLEYLRTRTLWLDAKIIFLTGWNALTCKKF